MKILVVDDEPKIRELIGQYLTIAGYETEFAKDGIEALNVITKGDIDLVILDVIQLKDYKPLVQQVQLFVGIKQEVIFTTLVIRFQDIEESPYVKILFACTFLFKYLLIFITDKLIERIE
jgi:DNA-binding NtrC family response regulator